MRKSVIISITASLVLTLVLMCFGIFGETITPYARMILFFIFKWGLVLFGYFLACFLPYRIFVALKDREILSKKIIEENKKILKHNAEVDEQEQEQELEKKILNAYYKEKDNV
jgi:hypothetical protein